MTHSDTQWWRVPTTDVAATPVGPETFRKQAQQGAGVSFWALMAFTFILLLAPQERFPALSPLRIAMVAAALAIAAHVYRRLSVGLPAITNNTPTRIVLLLLGWALITAPFSLWPGGSMAFLLEHFLKTIIVFMLLANVIDNPAKLGRITWGLVLISIPLAVTTVGNFMSGIPLQGGDRVAGYTAALTGNPNDMALMLNLILPLCIALLLASKRPGVRILLASIACLLVVAIVATFSRAGFLTLMVTGLTYLWFLRKRVKLAWLSAAVILALLAIPFIPSGYSERLSTIVNIEDDSSHSAQTRLQDMKSAARLVIANPLIGSGIGMNALALNELRKESWTEVHNVYLIYLVDLGLPGLVLFLCLYVHCLRATAVVLRSQAGDSSGGLFHIAEGLRVSLIAFAIAALFHPVAYHFYFFYIAGLAIAAETICKSAQSVQATRSLKGVGAYRVKVAAAAKQKEFIS